MHTVPADAGVTSDRFVVNHYQESGYVVSSNGGFESRSCGPRVYG